LQHEVSQRQRVCGNASFAINAQTNETTVQIGLIYNYLSKSSEIL